jgi:hypothetical protein
MPTKRKAKRVRAWLVLWDGKPGQVLLPQHWMAADVKDTFRSDCVVDCVVTYTPPRRKAGKR